MTTLYVYEDTASTGNSGASSLSIGNTSTVATNNVQPSQLVGTAYVNQRRGRLTTTFAYDQSFLARNAAFAIDPELPLQAGNWPSRFELPGSFMDSAPDRWGRNLINKRHPGRRLNNLDYLLGTSDITRQGALRFKTKPEEEFLYPDTKVPKLVALPELLDAARTVERQSSGEKNELSAVKILLDAGRFRFRQRGTAQSKGAS